MLALSQRIQDRLAALGNEKKARWLENYVKHDICSRGVGRSRSRFKGMECRCLSLEGQGLAGALCSK